MLTPPTPKPPKPERARVCPACKGIVATLPDDEADAFDLPREVCGCTIIGHHAMMAAQGFVPATDATLDAARRAKWPTRYGVHSTKVLKLPGVSGATRGHAVVKAFVSPVFAVALDAMGVQVDERGQVDSNASGAELVATMLRRVTDPQHRQAYTATARIGGPSALRELLFGKVRDAAGEEPATSDD